MGTHRRIPLEAVLVYKAEAHAKRTAALDEMSALHQEPGFQWPANGLLTGRSLNANAVYPPERCKLLTRLMCFPSGKTDIEPPLRDLTEMSA